MQCRELGEKRVLARQMVGDVCRIAAASRSRLVVLTSGSSRKTGSSVIETCVNTLSWRMKYSVIVAFALIGIPLRRCHPCLMCVVCTLSTRPCHSPVENPIQVCGASSGGCGRPSSQIVRSCA